MEVPATLFDHLAKDGLVGEVVHLVPPIVHVTDDGKFIVRWLPRHRLPQGIAFPVDGNDWWLFDDQTLAIGHFTDDFRVRGHDIITDPATTAECSRIRDQLWSLATPHRDYKPV